MSVPVISVTSNFTTFVFAYQINLARTHHNLFTQLLKPDVILISLLLLLYLFVCVRACTIDHTLKKPQEVCSLALTVHLQSEESKRACVRVFLHRGINEHTG